MPSFPVGMATTEIIELIKACKELGVTQFEGNGLKLEFGSSVATAVHGYEDPAAEKRNLEEAELRLRQEQLEHLKIEDPYTYEQMIAHDLGRSPV